MASFKKVLKNSTIYGLVTILQKGINLFLLPVYTVYLTTTDYGILAVVNSYIALLSIFFSFGLARSTVRFYFIYKDDKEKVKELWGTIITFIYTSSIIVFLIFFVFRKYLIIPFTKGIDFYPFILLGLISITLNPAFSIYNSTLPARHNAKKYSLNTISRFLTRLLLVISFVVVLKMSATGVLLATAITSLIFFIYTIFSFKKEIKLGINKKMLSETLKYSLPLLPMALSGWIFGMIDKIFLNNLKSTSSAGIYNIGFQFGFIMILIVNSIHVAFKPWFYENMELGDKGKRKIIKSAELFVLFYGSVALLISFFGQEILQIMVTENFREGWKVIPFISFSFVFSGIQYFFGYPIFYNIKKTKYLNIPIFVGAGINILLNILLIPKYGMIGAAITTLIAHFFSTSIMIFISRKVEFINYNWVKMYVITFIFFAISLFSFINIATTSLNFFSIKLMIVILIFGFIAKHYHKELIPMFNFVINRIKKN